MRSYLDNEDIADVLERVADLLETQRASPYRVAAYHRAARTVRGTDRPMADVVASEGRKGLERFAAIGPTIAAAIEELVETGHLGYLHRLEGQVSPEELFATVPGVGPTLARRLHDELHLDTLEELELAAHDGRLERLSGFGPRRARGLRDVLGAMLSRSSRRRARRVHDRDSHDEPDFEAPNVPLLLRVDEEYRVGADLGALKTIAPRRFNPTGAAWLPILHTDAEGWSFTALYSNTARAHELKKTHDWVIIYFERDGHESQCTVVTETHGPLSGRRVIRGREGECREYYAAEDRAA